MINRRFISKSLVIGCLAVSVFVQSTNVDARFKRRKHHHKYHLKNKSVKVLPGRFASITLSGLSYYYVKGVFYQKRDQGYIVVSAPRGAVVSNLPHGHKVIVVNKVKYYTFNDIYWKQAPDGYIVVSDPTPG
ncbi:MAG: hypothetical protein GY775_01655 [Candidatus Scalindua sp.]|nr:hypothetical protein [Candidatus Scalindua sp.]